MTATARKPLRTVLDRGERWSRSNRTFGVARASRPVSRCRKTLALCGHPTPLAIVHAEPTVLRFIPGLCVELSALDVQSEDGPVNSPVGCRSFQQTAQLAVPQTAVQRPSPVLGIDTRVVGL